MRGILLFALCMGASLPAGTTMVTYQFSGTITKINFNTNNAFPGSIGQEFRGCFSYASDSRTSEVGSVAFTIGSLESPVIDDRLYVPVTLPSFWFYYYGSDANYDYGRTGFTFNNYTGPAFGSQLPTDISLSMFSSILFRIQGSKIVNGIYQGNFDLSGPVTSLRLIPEPATVALLSIGLLLARRRTNTSRQA